MISKGKITPAFRLHGSRLSGRNCYHRSVLSAGLLFGTLFFASCARHKPPVFDSSAVQTGIASWYGPDFHGKLTSNKEIYNMHDMTAAHKTLPFGTFVMVTNLENGKTTTVRINDRGPFVGERIIDLSYAAARVLGVVGPGTVMVRLEVLKDISPDPADVGWSVQVGSFASKENASKLADKLKPKYGDVYVSLFKTAEQTYYRVRVGAADKSEAEDIASRLNAGGVPVIILEER